MIYFPHFREETPKNLTSQQKKLLETNIFFRKIYTHGLSSIPDGQNHIIKNKYNLG